MTRGDHKYSARGPMMMALVLSVGAGSGGAVVAQTPGGGQVIEYGSGSLPDDANTLSSAEAPPTAGAAVAPPASAPARTPSSGRPAVARGRTVELIIGGSSTDGAAKITQLPVQK